MTTPSDQDVASACPICMERALRCEGTHGKPAVLVTPSGAPITPAPVFTEAETLAAMKAVREEARSVAGEWAATRSSSAEFNVRRAIHNLDLRAILNRIRGGR